MNLKAANLVFDLAEGNVLTVDQLKETTADAMQELYNNTIGDINKKIVEAHKKMDNSLYYLLFVGETKESKIVRDNIFNVFNIAGYRTRITEHGHLHISWDLEEKEKENRG